MDGKREPLSKTELYELKWLLGGALAVVSLWTLLAVTPGFGVVGLSLVATVGVLVKPQWTARWPRKVWTWAALGILALAVVDLVLHAGAVAGPMARMAALLTWARAAGARRRREDFQLVVLCLLSVVVAGALTSTFLFAWQMLLFTGLALLLLALVCLYEAYAEGGEVPAEAWGQFRWRRFGRRLRRFVDGRVVVAGLVLYGAMLVLAAVFFVIMPRFNLAQALPFLRLEREVSYAGFSDEVRFGEVVEIQEDRRVVMRVDVELDSLPGRPYWRMVALDAFDGEGFAVSEDALEHVERFRGHEFGRDATLREGGWTFYVEGGVSRYLARTGTWRALRFPNREELEVNGRLRTLSLEKARAATLVYRVFGMESGERMPAHGVDRLVFSTEGADGSRYPWTTLGLPLSEGEVERLRGTAGEIAAVSGIEDGDTRGMSRAVTAWLHERHGYALGSRVPAGDGNVLVRWMYSREPGHCELFAGSFALLMRAGGYPTRLVTGFAGGDWNGYEGYWMIRGSDAHAWCEVYDGSDAWIRVDPTAPPAVALDATVGAELGRPTVTGTWAYIDALRMLWYRRVVNFDEGEQRELAQALREGFERWWAGAKEWLREPLRWWRGEWSWERLGHWEPWGWLLALMLTAVLIYRIRRRESRLQAKRRSRRLRSRVRRRASGCLRELRERGVRPEPLHGELLVLRYGAPEDWPPAREVFRRYGRLRAGVK